MRVSKFAFIALSTAIAISALACADSPKPTPAPTPFGQGAPILTEPAGDEWITLSGPAFSLNAPPGSEIRHLFGSDSRIGEITVEGITIHFDAGPYGARLERSAGAVIEGDRIWWNEEIDGRESELGAGSDWAHITIFFDRGGHLVAWGQELEGMEQAKLLLRVFRTVTIVDDASPYDQVYAEQFPPESLPQ